MTSCQLSTSTAEVCLQTLAKSKIIFKVNVTVVLITRVVMACIVTRRKKMNVRVNVLFRIQNAVVTCSKFQLIVFFNPLRYVFFILCCSLSHITVYHVEFVDLPVQSLLLLLLHCKKPAFKNKKKKYKNWSFTT